MSLPVRAQDKLLLCVYDSASEHAAGVIVHRRGERFRHVFKPFAAHDVNKFKRLSATERKTDVEEFHADGTCVAVREIENSEGIFTVFKH